MRAGVLGSVSGTTVAGSTHVTSIDRSCCDCGSVRHAGLRAEGPAANQGPSPEEIDKKMQEQALDAQYRSALKRTKPSSAPARPDPWANTRETDAQKR